MSTPVNSTQSSPVHADPAPSSAFAHARATVEVIEEAGSRLIAVPRGGLRIGRSPQQGLVLDAPSVSAEHAELSWQGDDLFARDVGSSYGTRREGSKLLGSVLLHDGDELVLGGKVVLRVSIFGARFGAPASQLLEQSGLVRTDAPHDVQPLAMDLLPMVETLYAANSGEDLADRITRAVADHFRPSRVALLELEGAGERFRVLSLRNASAVDERPLRDAAFVSRTVVHEAVLRGVSCFRSNGGPMQVKSMIRSGAHTAAAAAIRPRDRRVRVLYMDAVIGDAPLSWSHALALELFAAHAAGCFDAFDRRIADLERQRRFEQLRRYFSPAVVEHILASGGEAVERPRMIDATVLFADLVGYTSLSERLKAEPERLLGLLNRWLDAGARAVTGHAGALDKFIGDCVMALFGAPFPQPEAEVLAVRCALEMQQAIARIAQETGEPLQITVGINSGPMLAGSVGSKRRLEYTVMGDTVNVAARLQGQAKPGEILVGPHTQMCIDDDVLLEDAGEFTLKNHGPVRAYRVKGLRY
jgi:adenylate cyclase